MTPPCVGVRPCGWTRAHVSDTALATTLAHVMLFVLGVPGVELVVCAVLVLLFAAFVMVPVLVMAVLIVFVLVAMMAATMVLERRRFRIGFLHFAHVVI